MISINDYAKKYSDCGEPLKFGDVSSPLEISLVEDSLGVGINGQFRSFLETVGGVSIFGSWVNGIPKDIPLTTSAGNVHGDTVRLRESGLPKKFLVISTSEEEFAVCLDASVDGESPVYGVSIPFEGDPKMIALDFETYLEESLQSGLEAID